MKRRDKALAAIRGGQAAPPAGAAERPDRARIDRAIATIRGRIALIEKDFADVPVSMACRDDLAVALWALEQERERG